jgi:hypothetical protein
MTLHGTRISVDIILANAIETLVLVVVYSYNHARISRCRGVRQLLWQSIDDGDVERARLGEDEQLGSDFRHLADVTDHCDGQFIGHHRLHT